MRRVAGTVMRLFGGRSCEDVVATLCDYYEGSIDPKLAAIIERHLRGCKDCSAFARTYAEVVKLTGELPTEEEVPEELRERIRRALEERAAGKP